MIWMTMSPRSTRTHSPVCSPSTPRTLPPPSLTFSATFRASALVCRADSALATIMKSNKDVSLRVSSTTMSRALISSSACKAMSRSCSACIHVLVELMLTNIIENGVGKQIARTPALRDTGADTRCRYVERGDGANGEQAGGAHVQVRQRLGMPGFQLARKRRRQSSGFQREARSARDRNVGQVEQALT